MSEEICKGCFCGRWSYVVSCCIVNVNSGSRLACPASMWLPAFPRHQACSVLLRAREGVSLSLLPGCGHKLHSVVLHLICWPLARSRSHPSFEMSHLYVTYLQAVSWCDSWITSRSLVTHYEEDFALRSGTEQIFF